VLHASPPGAVDVVGGDGEIEKQEVPRIGVVGVNAADFGRGDDGGIGLFSRIERLDGGLRSEVQLLARAQHE